MSETSPPYASIPSPREKSAADTRDRILQTAARVFALKGYSAATLDGIAREAGMTKGAIYWHFRSKSDLFFALLDFKFAQHMNAAPEDLRQAAEIATRADKRVAMTELLKTVVRRILEDRDWPRLYLEFIGQARDPEMRAQLAQFHADSMQRVVGLIRLMQGLGLAPAQQEPVVLAHFWTALFDGLIVAWLIDPANDPVARIEGFVPMLLDGLSPDATQTPTVTALPRNPA